MEDIGNIFYVMFTLESFTEYGIGYILLHGFLNEKFSLKLKHTVLIFFLLLISLFLISVRGIVTGASFLPPPFISAFLVTGYYVVMAKLLFKKVMWESFFLGIQGYLITGLLFLINIPILSFFMNLLSLNLYFVSVALYLLMWLMAVSLYKKAPLNKLHRMTQSSGLSSTLIRRALLLFYLTLVLLQQYNSRSFYAQMVLIYTVVIVLLLTQLVLPIVKNHLYQTKKEISGHDLYNDLLSTGIALENVRSIDEVKAKFKAHAERLGVELPNASVSEIQSKPVSQQIERFIKLKQMQRQSGVEIIPDVSYYNDHKTVDLQLLLQWLGTLLDNAIDASITHPIYVRLMVTSSRLSLQVSNEYLGTDREDFEAWFTQGYSTKGEGRGLGLYHLNETVTNLGGTLACFEEFNEVHRTSYLHLVIKFR